MKLTSSLFDLVAHGRDPERKGAIMKQGVQTDAS